MAGRPLAPRPVWMVPVHRLQDRRSVCAVLESFGAGQPFDGPCTGSFIYIGLRPMQHANAHARNKISGQLGRKCF